MSKTIPVVAGPIEENSNPGSIQGAVALFRTGNKKTLSSARPLSSKSSRVRLGVAASNAARSLNKVNAWAAGI
ncbi:hypothetical protein D4Z78_20620 [Okeania hirsuta]|nr:hypothetical protein D4Z78_20620 [Okeania hirsuta]